MNVVELVKRRNPRDVSATFRPPSPHLLIFYYSIPPSPSSSSWSSWFWYIWCFYISSFSSFSLNSARSVLQTHLHFAHPTPPVSLILHFAHIHKLILSHSFFSLFNRIQYLSRSIRCFGSLIIFIAIFIQFVILGER